MKRKMFLAAVLGLSTLTAVGQTAYTVTGTTSTDMKKVYLLDVANRHALIDSAVVAADGKFQMKGTQAENAVLGLGYKDYVVLFINDGTPIDVSLPTQTLKGSPQNEKLNAYDRELTPLEIQMGNIVALARSGKVGKEQMDSIGKVYSVLSEKREARVMEIMRENKDNMIPVAYIGDMAYGLSYSQLKELCDPSRPYYNHPSMTLPKRLLDGLEKRAPGKLFTDMTIPDMDGKEHKLSEWIGKGQYVMVDFWASWCGPCRQEMPNVVQNYEKYHEKGFEIIGISFDQKAEPWKKAVEQMKMTWPQLSDLRYWQSAAAGVYGISAIPASILFDKEGKIMATDLRGAKLGEKLKELYGF